MSDYIYFYFDNSIVRKSSIFVAKMFKKAFRRMLKEIDYGREKRKMLYAASGVGIVLLVVFIGCSLPVLVQARRHRTSILTRTTPLIRFT